MPDREPPVPPLGYASDPETLDSPPRRTIRTGLILAAVWIIGLGIWALYLAMIGWVVFRLFS